MHYPIIYVRGFAMGKGVREETSNDPFQGFNQGSTRIRQNPDKSFKQHIFESPLIRLMTEYGYEDGYADGELAQKPPKRPIYIHRYYEDEHGRPHNPSIETAAKGLNSLISDVRKRMIAAHDNVTDANFKVYIVAHSMGGLITRCFLQNSQHHDAANVAAVEKVFTYGTPHGGITFFDGINVPNFLSVENINNFNRKRMKDYLDVPSEDKVQSLNGKFDPQKFFCFVGTNNKDYELASKHFINEPGDGLVSTRNAYVEGAYRGYSYVSHSGPYGMVNSEAGYQSLVRFLFGDLYIAARLDVEEIPIPKRIRKAIDDGKKVEGSYLFESIANPNIYPPQPLYERKTDHSSAIIKSYDELMAKGSHSEKSKPILFSLFLDRSKRASRNSPTVRLGLELKVLSTDFKIIDGGWFNLDKRVANHVWFLNNLNLLLNPEAANEQDKVRYSWVNEAFDDSRGKQAKMDDQGLYIPLSNKLGFKAKLRFTLESR